MYEFVTGMKHFIERFQFPEKMPSLFSQQFVARISTLPPNQQLSMDVELYW